jgi:hypothetical protein
MRQNSSKKCPKQVVYAGEADIVGLESYLMMGLRINVIGLMGCSGQLQIYLVSWLKYSTPSSQQSAICLFSASEIQYFSSHYIPLIFVCIFSFPSDFFTRDLHAKVLYSFIGSSCMDHTIIGFVTRKIMYCNKSK